MFEDVRKNFVRDSMILSSLLLLVGVLLLYAMTYSYEEGKADQIIENYQDTIDVAISNDDQVLFYSFHYRFEDVNETVEDAYIIVMNNDKEVIATAGNVSSLKVQGVTRTVDSAVNYISDMTLARKSTGAMGNIPGYDIRYGITKVSGGYMAILVDQSSYTSETNRFLLIIILSALVGLVMLWIVSRSMARRAIEPMVKSVEDQNRFLADASHELKTPLTVILANMDIALANEDSTIAEQRKWLESTKDEAVRMSGLVTDMLSLSRSDAQSTEYYQFMRTDVSDLVDDCIMTSEAIAFEKHITLTSSLTEHLYAIVDEAKIKQVVFILLDNAIKYAGDQGSVRVSLRGENKSIVFTIYNTGDPIPEAKSRDIFERFFRVDDSRTKDEKSKAGGYGLGLSIARNIVTKHGGKITLDYSDETGTCFSFTLPDERNARSPEPTMPDLEKPLA